MLALVLLLVSAVTVVDALVCVCALAVEQQSCNAPTRAHKSATRKLERESIFATTSVGTQDRSIMLVAGVERQKGIDLTQVKYVVWLNRSGPDRRYGKGKNYCYLLLREK